MSERLRATLEQIRSGAEAVQLASGIFFTPSAVRLIFVSPLADGADQIAAEIALELGYELHAILPFARNRYRLDLTDDDARRRLDDLLKQSTCVLELPGSSAQDLDAYVMAGRATVAHGDVLIAVWDGLPARGRGGTGDIVSFAFERATPIIHVPVNAHQPTKLRWSAFEPAVVTRMDDAATSREFDSEQLRGLLGVLLAPPPDPQEQEFIRLFQRECRRRLRPRIEYPLMLAATGVSRLRRHHWRGDIAEEFTRKEWQGFCEACDRAEAVSTPNGNLQAWYTWADSLASHYAQSYRSGHVFNFVLAATAVLLALATLVAPDWKKLLAFAEFGAVLLILANTWTGNKYQWHRRWLDYRQLAERLRPMRSLKIVGVSSPDPPGTAANPVARRWVEWYACAVWRAVGCPNGNIAPAGVHRLAETIAEHELAPQTAYHRASAQQAERLDGRLEAVGYALFGLALLGCVVLIAGFWLAPEWVKHNSNLFTILSAGLPAIGTAVIGIRVQGDYVGGAVRSEHTARVLEQIAGKLRNEGADLNRAGDLVEQAARAMLSDLDEWRLLNQQHDLSVG